MNKPITNGARTINGQLAKAVKGNRKNNFRKNLKAICKKKRLTNAALADMTDMSQSKIQRLMDCSDTNKGMIDLSDAISLSEAVGTSLGYLCGQGQTDRMLKQTLSISAFATDYLGRLESYESQVVADKKVIKEIKEYMSGVVQTLDALVDPG